MKKIFSFKLFLIITLFFLLVFIYAKLGFNHWQIVAAIDKPVIEAGWSEPIAVGINTADWEGDVYVADDGNTLFYSYYPGDLIKDQSDSGLLDDIEIYYSEKPFERSVKHPASEDLWSERGVMLSDSDIYYVSDRNHLGSNDLYKNGQLLLNTPSKSEIDLHYCAAKNELYFSTDNIIYIYQDNKTKALSAPINDGSQNIQPFLTKDCQEMYFASNRGDGVLKIFKAGQLADTSWSQPELVIASKHGVGNPSLTADGRYLFFTQIFKSAKGGINSDIFYIEKIDSH